MAKRKKAVIGWKKVYVEDKWGRTFAAILKLEILGPVSGPATDWWNTGKCRTNKVRVLSAKVLRHPLVMRAHFAKKPTKFFSGHDYSFIYTVGKVKMLRAFERSLFRVDSRVACTTGIHFFLTRKEAVDYY